MDNLWMNRPIAHGVTSLNSSLNGVKGRPIIGCWVMHFFYCLACDGGQFKRFIVRNFLDIQNPRKKKKRFKVLSHLQIKNFEFLTQKFISSRNLFCSLISVPMSSVNCLLHWDELYQIHAEGFDKSECYLRRPTLECSSSTIWLLCENTQCYAVGLLQRFPNLYNLIAKHVFRLLGIHSTPICLPLAVAIVTWI